MTNKENKTLEQLKAEAESARRAYEGAKKLAELKEKEEAERKKVELVAAQTKRKKEIEEAEKHYHDLVRQYIKDYGEYEMSYSYEDGDDFLSFLFGSKPFKFFL